MKAWLRLARGQDPEGTEVRLIESWRATLTDLRRQRRAASPCRPGGLSAHRLCSKFSASPSGAPTNEQVSAPNHFSRT